MIHADSEMTLKREKMVKGWIGAAQPACFVRLLNFIRQESRHRWEEATKEKTARGL